MAVWHGNCAVHGSFESLYSDVLAASTLAISCFIASTSTLPLTRPASRS